MTIYGHNMTMKQVRIAELKARLSEHLRAVRNGETIACSTVTRRSPISSLSGRVARFACANPPGRLPLHRVPLPKPANLKIDIVDVLLEERQGHR